MTTQVESVQHQRTLEDSLSKGRSRYEELSIPKMSKATYWTSFGPKLVWGNQEPMWPINQAALRTTPTQRTCQLAQAKRNHRKEDMYMPEFEYSCGRNSQIWLVRDGAKRAVSSHRVSSLARHKTVPHGYLEHRPQFYYSCGRSSAIWPTSPGAIKCGDRPRTASLAAPKRTHPDYLPGRPTIQTIVPESAKQYSVTSHTESLAVPKKHVEGPFREPQWEVSKASKEATPTDRLVDLAKAKKLADGYQPCKSVVWKVSTGARNAVASTRMEELSSPIVRETMDHVQFNPDAFRVSEMAKKYKPTSRIEELAKPIERGTG